jgi:hypothetical protein
MARFEIMNFVRILESSIIGTVLTLFYLIVIVVNTGCGVLKKREKTETELVTSEKPLSEEEAKELLGEVGENWFYGSGLGKAAVNVAGVVVFPPYAIYLLGNGLISAFGYEPLYITDALPNEERNDYNEAYEAITSVPGRFTAAVASEEYRSNEVIKERMERFKTPRELRDESIRAQPKANFNQTYTFDGNPLKNGSSARNPPLRRSMPPDYGIPSSKRF